MRAKGLRAEEGWSASRIHRALALSKSRKLIDLGCYNDFNKSNVDKGSKKDKCF